MKSLVLLGILLVSNIIQSQTIEWVKSMGSLINDRGLSIKVDNDDNVYTTGSYRLTVDFDPGPGIFNLTSEGDRDLFIQKLDGDGNFIWARSIGDIGGERGKSIDVDSFGNVYVTGEFNGIVDFDPGPGVFVLAGNNDVFVLKLNTNGDFEWAKSMGGQNFESGNAIAIDSSGNVYTSGIFGGNVDFDPGPGTFILIGGGVFVQKLDTDGNFIWAKSIGVGFGISIDSYTIQIDSSGNVYTGGAFIGTVDFDPGPGTFNLTPNGEVDGFIQKMDSNGNFLWAEHVGGVLEDAGNSLSIDNSGNVYFIGYFEGMVDFDSGPGTTNLISAGEFDIFILKLDPSGTFRWANSMGGSARDFGNSISVDDFGFVYTTGSFEGTVDFDPGPGIANLSSIGEEDFYIQKLDPNGNFLWATSTGSELRDIGNSISIDASGDVYTTGVYNQTVDFDPGSGINNLTSEGLEDIFVYKLKDAPLGIEIFQNNPEVTAFPNPFRDYITIVFENAMNDVEITLSNLQGKVISNQKYNTLSTMVIEVPAPSGIYFLTVKTSVSQAVIKLVKE